jgi:V8-like Glu-specific endopeptidase
VAIQLSRDDFRRLVDILRQTHDFAIVRDRRRLVEAALEGSDRGPDLLAQLDLDGNPQQVAVEVVRRLAEFGHVAYGKEALGVLLNYIQPFLDQGPAAFIDGLFERYPMEGGASASRALSAWRGMETPHSVQEKIIGENTLRDVCMLEKALAASQAVARLRVTPNGQAWVGSGFMIAWHLLMTNHHVIENSTQAENTQCWFNYQLGANGKPLEATLVRSLKKGLFHTNPELDFTVVQLENPPHFDHPLPLRSSLVARDSRVSIIQHPGGHFKKISMQNNFVEYIDGHTLQYTTSTEPGSSGSPVFDDDFNVVAIHHSGGMISEPGTGRRYLRNAGSSMTAILEDLKVHAPGIYDRLGH